MLDQRRQHRDVRVKLNLAGHIDDDEVFLGQGVDGVGDEVEVLEEEFETVDQPAVGAQAHLLHHIGEGDEVFDV